MKIRIKTAEELLNTEGVSVGGGYIKHRDGGCLINYLMRRHLGRVLRVEMNAQVYKSEGANWEPWMIAEVIEDKPVEVVVWANIYPKGDPATHLTEDGARSNAMKDALAVAVKLTGSYIPKEGQ